MYLIFEVKNVYILYLHRSTQWSWVNFDDSLKQISITLFFLYTSGRLRLYMAIYLTGDKSVISNLFLLITIEQFCNYLI